MPEICRGCPTSTSTWPGRSRLLTNERRPDGKSYRQIAETERQIPASGPPAEFRQHFLSGDDATILGFLENGDAAEVRVGKEYAVIEARQAAALFGENGADGGANHGVAHAHNVNARDALTDVGVNAPEVVEDGLFPVGPFFFEEKLAVL